MTHHLLREDGERMPLTTAIGDLDPVERGSVGGRTARRGLVLDRTGRA